ncbi:MAG: nucleotidyltransferase family protein [Euryarchaeota archaeon]|nr:nucleotidyltransferase family protein [Euryarchaeota archaeon]
MKRESIFKEVAAFLAERGAKRIGVFGSYARGEQRSGSDLDLVVEFRDPKSLLDLVGMEQDLSEALGIKVDLLTEKSISPHLIERVREETVEIYAS